ncbi:MAG: NTP transferase domain-containing protein, partial [Christensenella sp.]
LSLLEWVVSAARGADMGKCIVVCGKGGEEVKKQCGNELFYVEQSERKGSGHAVMCAMSELEGFSGYTLIIAGDMPLLRAETVNNLVNTAENGDYACLLLSARLDNPFGYGRIVRAESGYVTAIAEERDATDEQREINEVNASCYCVKNSVLLQCLKKIQPKNAQGEYYLTDIVEIINREKMGTVGAYAAEDARECMGVNDRAQLAQV